MKRMLSRRIVFIVAIHAVLVSCDFTFYWTRRSSLMQVVYVGGPPFHELEDVMVSVDDGGGLQSFTGQRLSAESSGALIHTRTHGTAKVRVMLALSDTITGASFELPLKRDQIHFISIFAATRDSVFRAFEWGRGPRLVVPMRPGHREAVRDSIWIDWGSNSISHPVIY